MVVIWYMDRGVENEDFFFFNFRRILGLAVGAYARRLGFILTVDTFKITAATGIKICIQKVWIQSSLDFYTYNSKT